MEKIFRIMVEVDGYPSTRDVLKYFEDAVISQEVNGETLGDRCLVVSAEKIDATISDRFDRTNYSA